MMKIATLLVVLMSIAFTSAQTAVEPVEGDMGTIQHCVPTGEDGDECKSCFEEREEEEEEEGEEKEAEDQAPVQKCIDKCSQAYTITQLADATLLNIECEMNGGEDCEETKYQRIALEPQVGCVDGCSCPNATGYMVAPEANDEEAADEDQKYELKFWTEEGAVNTYFTGGEVEIVQAKDGAENTNEVTLEIKYQVTEKKDDDAAEEEQREMECRVPYFISAGKVGGVTAKSGEPAPEKQPVAQAHGNGRLEMINTFPEDECSGFNESSKDACWLECAAAFAAETTNGSFTFAPEGAAISDDCTCHFGKGAQVGYGEEYSTAQITFNEDSFQMCTPVFNAELLEIDVANTNYDGAFTIQWTTENKQVCTSTYKVASGAVLGISPPIVPPASKKTGGVVAGTVIGVVVVVVAVVAVFKRRGNAGSYQGIP